MAACSISTGNRQCSIRLESGRYRDAKDVISTFVFISLNLEPHSRQYPALDALICQPGRFLKATLPRLHELPTISTLARAGSQYQSSREVNSMSVAIDHVLAAEVDSFFARNPKRRYFVRVAKIDHAASFCKLFIIPNEDPAYYGVAIDWHLENEPRSLDELLSWFNSDPYAEILIEALLPESARRTGTALISVPKRPLLS